MKSPDVQYARSGDVEVAYQVLGEGPVDDGPARAIACAHAIRRTLGDLGLDIRAGKLRGIAVHIGARVAHEAAPGEVPVSSTVKDLVAGSGLEFDDRGAYELKGVPGEWRLFAVAA